MSVPSPLTLAHGSLAIAGQAAARIAHGRVVLHESVVEMSPSRDSTDRQVAAVSRWLEISIEVVAADPLVGLPLIGESVTAALAIGSLTLSVTEAHLTGYSVLLEAGGVRESLTLRCERWTLDEG